MPDNNGHLPPEPQWYKDAVIYELHVKAFMDSSGDGMGDIKGVTAKLDYLKELGVTAIWLLPFYPSPLRDDGYDIADYMDVHPNYGKLSDFRILLREAHKRGLRVITELVLNHTSDRHEWFQKARLAKPGSAARDFYVWSEGSDKYPDARIIFKDYETSNWTWDREAQAYFWHRFYSHQPDLNWDNPRVKKAMLKVLDHWFAMGVDGMRLDAVPYLFEREGTNCENLPETHQCLKEIRSHVEAKFPGRMLLAEANQWPEDAVAYFGSGDECHMAFHFPIMPRIFMSLWMEDRFPLMDILEQTPAIPDACQWAMFLRNHDELTLEMVSDEERDFMYRVYAKDPRARINLGIRRRLAPLMGNNRRKIELINFLLFSFPGTPIIYYGDEIGMGDNYHLGDRDGVRTPMQWSPDRNAGFSRVNPHQLYLPVIIDPEYHFEVVNVENQERNLSSLLWWMRRVIAMRRRFKAFGRGDISFVPGDNPKVLAFTRSLKDENNDETLLVVVNLSRFSQVAELDLSALAGQTPVDVFSETRFPPIRKEPYVLPLGFHDYYWFRLAPTDESANLGSSKPLPEISLENGLSALARMESARTLEAEVLPRHLEQTVVPGLEPRRVRSVTVEDVFRLGSGKSSPLLIILRATFKEGEPAYGLVPIALALGDAASALLAESPGAVLAQVRTPDETGVLFDATLDERFRDLLPALFCRRNPLRGASGSLAARPGRDLADLMPDPKAKLASQRLRGEMNNLVTIHDNALLLKLYRRPEPGPCPEVEMLRYLSDAPGFQSSPVFGGSLEYRPKDGPAMPVGLLESFLPGVQDGMSFAREAAQRYFSRIIEIDGSLQPPALPPRFGLESDAFPEPPPPLDQMIDGFFLEMIAMLGRRTADMHLALCRPTRDQDFAPEPFSLLYQRSAYQAMRNLVRTTARTLRRTLKHLAPDILDLAQGYLDREAAMVEHMKVFAERRFNASKTRIHGDFHLRHVLFTGKDFMIVDFEGEPDRAQGERRLKRSPLRDVAHMLVSLDSAVMSALGSMNHLQPEAAKTLSAWLAPWSSVVGATFLAAYLEHAEGAPFLPKRKESLASMLGCFLLERAAAALERELESKDPAPPPTIAGPLALAARLLDEFGPAAAQPS